MNKYQKSIHEIETFVRNKSEVIEGSYQGQFSLNVLQELVDRATPAIPLTGLTLSAAWNIKVICRCGNILGRKNHFCSNCGQAIDWEGCYVQ